MAGYVKIHQCVLDSSIWQEPEGTRLVFLTMLVMADQEGHVEASVSGLARRANVSIDSCRRALETLSSPDPDDRSGVENGVRISKVPRGWFVINHKYYRDLRTDKQIATAARVQAHRSRTRTVTRNDVTSSNGVKRSVASASASEADQGIGEHEGEGAPTPAAPHAPRRDPTRDSFVGNLPHQRADVARVVERFAAAAKMPHVKLGTNDLRGQLIADFIDGAGVDAALAVVEAAVHDDRVNGRGEFSGGEEHWSLKYLFQPDTAERLLKAHKDRTTRAAKSRRAARPAPEPTGERVPHADVAELTNNITRALR